MSALPDSPAVFTLTGFVTGATCNASGDKVSGYDPPNASDCQNVPLATKGECTIVYTPTTIFLTARPGRHEFPNGHLESGLGASTVFAGLGHHRHRLDVRLAAPAVPLRRLDL